MMRKTTIEKHGKWIYGYIVRHLQKEQDIPHLTSLIIRLPRNLLELELDAIIKYAMDHLGAEQANPKYIGKAREALTLKRHIILVQLEWLQHLYLLERGKGAFPKDAYSAARDLIYKSEDNKKFANIVCNPVSYTVKLIEVLKRLEQSATKTSQITTI
ncbi:MAG: hypothetical protein ABW007_19185 [Chitinophagaceae bacterium]